MQEAQLYCTESDQRVRCGLCPHECRIAPDARGLCGVRENRDGQLYSLVYGRAIAEHVDPIEKKPLFHLLPGSASYSVATVGCNLRCKHCQNADISQQPATSGTIAGRERAPEEIVKAAIEAECQSISCTYTEPTVFFEYALDIVRLARQQGLKTCWVTNGYTTTAAIDLLAPHLDAANIDLKGDDEFYRTTCNGQAAPVRAAIAHYHQQGVFVEVTTLIIPGRNDRPDQLQEIAAFLVDLSPSIPWHVTAFYPTYQLIDAPPTPVGTLAQAREIGLAAGLRYVYTGNVPAPGSEDTCCPQCGAAVIRRRHFSLVECRVDKGACAACGAPIDGIFA